MNKFDKVEFALQIGLKVLLIFASLAMGAFTTWAIYNQEGAFDIVFGSVATMMMLVSTGLIFKAYSYEEEDDDIVE